MPNPALRRREGARAAYRSLSSSQQHAIDWLRFAVPRHPTDLSGWGVRPATLRSLERAGLARETFWTERNCSYSIGFWTLTQRGRELKRAVA